MATHADADIILKMYDLRREMVCRQARAFFASWMPTTAEEARLAGTGMGREDNAWVRQATTYWEMAFSLANTGAVDAELFAKNCGEGLLFMVKCQLLKTKFAGVWTRSMGEAETFVAGNATAAKKADIFRARFA